MSSRKKSETPTRIYAYALPKGPLPEDAEAVAAELHRARLLRNDLIAIERERRQRYRDKRRGLFPNLVAIEECEAALVADVDDLAAQIKKAKAATRSRTVDEISRAGLKRKRAELKGLRVRKKALRDACQSDALEAFAEENNEWSKARIRETYASWGGFWPTFNFVKQSLPSGKADPEHRRWDVAVSMRDGGSMGGDGVIAVQIQSSKRLFDTGVMACTDSRVRVEVISPDRKKPRAMLWLRVGSTEDRLPVWARFPMLIHRPLPDGAEVKQVWVQRYKSGPSRFRWQVCFVIESPTFVKPVRIDPRPSCAVKIGWKLLADGALRVAHVVGTDGYSEAITLSPRNRERFAYVNEKRGQRDDNFEALKKKIGPLLDNAPEDVAAMFEHYQQWRSTKRMLAVAYAMRGQGVPANDPLMAALHRWMRNERHNWDTEEGVRSRAINSRNESYRLAARRLAERYGEIRVSNVDLSGTAKKPGPEDKHALEQAQREQRHQAAPSEFVAAMKLAASNVGTEVVKVDAAGARSTCHVCGEKCDPGAADTHDCERCGASWSVDENHCRNLLSSNRDLEALA